uniref:Uncharacterized protein n=1 Tax=Candidatus Aschnera chinzeii TaxID=1485666 RepID=A0AAT9G4L8_9ENTR|nr:MAG: hypothetical protein ACHINZ_3380 [Candidatus Aschnera chinzeii]
MAGCLCFYIQKKNFEFQNNIYISYNNETNNNSSLHDEWFYIKQLKQFDN